MQTDRKNVLLLAACQALLVTNNVVLISINGLAGHFLADNKSLATLPVTCFVVGGALCTMPASLLMHRVGRKGGFMLGASIGIVSAALCAFAVYAHQFWLLCASNAIFGAYNACAQYYRFAAADTASSDYRERAISLVLAGGIVGAILGPESSKLTKGALETPFVGSYLSLIVCATLVLLIVRNVSIPPLSEQERAQTGRSLSEIARQPVFIVAVLGATIGYTVMNLLMTATPLAMQACHHDYSDSAFVIEWHVLGMYVPAFFTGSLIKRFGVLHVMLAGAGLLLGCVAIALSGVDLMHFWLALVLLGVGWSFLYVGGTTLLTQSYVPAERAKTQGLNDLLVFSSLGVSSLSAGFLVNKSGWGLVNLASLPAIAIAVLAIGALRARWGSGRAPLAPKAA